MITSEELDKLIPEDHFFALEYIHILDKEKY